MEFEREAGKMAKYWTSQQVAEYLNLTVYRVRELARDGLLPSVRTCPRGQLRFDPAAVEQALQASTAIPQTTGAAG